MQISLPVTAEQAVVKMDTGLYLYKLQGRYASVISGLKCSLNYVATNKTTARAFTKTYEVQQYNKTYNLI